MSDRREALGANLAVVQDRIARATAVAGRAVDDVELVVVTKYFPAADVDLLVDLGVRHIGENKDQEAGAKVAELSRRDLVTVHFVGQLQSNKVGHVAAYADVVQSVDRPKIVSALDRAVGRHDRTLEVLLQVSLEDRAGRGGVVPEEALRLADLVGDAAHLTLRGVMAVAPLGGEARRSFARLREVADGIRAGHPDATWISAGMSGDLEEAVAEGATHLRVGTAILGSRASLG
ncbi:alanine racemase [Knoellia sinensis KCTC 19936]|uniref:Pyridoxal phosphate homeostasis protein n=1 Tax=Knoellia sinensis KCTC 19936 TaxID=1385520 RepID=A0A0A0J7H4_9MICO|nr:YggS family pyridoxal phosphate-dependent enzyme [Knoellia sinensis]KGN33123.1 alanine racemase [Knoellia sinensis KCTC 19936]